MQCGFSGGEPLLRDDLEILVGEARRLGYYTNLITSGVGLTEARLDAFKAAGLDHIQLSFQDSTREINDFLSHTRTFDLKQKVARMIRERGWPMVMNVVIHRLNIGQIGRIIEMADELGAEYLELANAQYYSWALLNREQLMPSREQLREAEVVTNEWKARLADRMRILFVVPDYHEGKPKKCMNGWGNVFLTVTPDGTGAALPHRPHAARPELPQGWRQQPARNLVRLAGLQPLSRYRLDETALPRLRAQGRRPRRLPLPGLSARLAMPRPPTPVCPKSPKHDRVLDALVAAERPGAAQRPLIFRDPQESRRRCAEGA